MVNPSNGLTSYSVDERFDILLQDIEFRNRRYSYGNVDQQLATIKNNLTVAKNNPQQLYAYKQQLLPHLERLDMQLKRLVA